MGTLFFTMRILIVEDSQKLTRNIQSYLQTEHHYTVDVAFDGDTGLEKALKGGYDCIILDIKLPGRDGFSVCSALRSQKIATPILMLTSLSEDKDVIRGLDEGADDYLKKPFAMDELCARIRSLLRRKTSEANPLLAAGNVELDPNAAVVRKGNKIISLAPKEYALLEFLLRNKGVVQSRENIIEHVWGEREEILFSQTLDVHIAYLRKKLDRDLIETVSGKGYLIPAS